MTILKEEEILSLDDTVNDVDNLDYLIEEDKLNEHIDKINFSIDTENFKQCNSCDDYTFVIYGSDWFVGITVDGNIVKKEHSFDERSKLEIFNALQMINEKIKSGELNNNINDVMLDSMIKESAAYGK